MKFVPATWVAPEVLHHFSIAEASENGSEDLERDCARRLVTDLRMKDLYENSYLKTVLSGAGWRHWFDIAKSTLSKDLKQTRHKLKEHAKAIEELAECLENAHHLMLKIDEIDAGEAAKPVEMHSPLALIYRATEQLSDGRQSDLPSLFRSYVKPSLDVLNGFRVGKYIPTVSQLVDALALTVSNYSNEMAMNGPKSRDCEIAAALISRQHAPLPEYVRSFDHAMRFGTGCSEFLMPADLMAIQAAVVLNLQVVDSKQIKSARSISQR